jgi:hypothetical protein
MVLVLMGYSSRAHGPVPCDSAHVPSVCGRGKGTRQLLQQFKSQGFRILLILSTLASSALVLEAGQRWK